MDWRKALIIMGGVAGFSFVIWFAPYLIRAIQAEIYPPPPAAVISTVGGGEPVVSDHENDSARLTGYYLEFPEGTEDWRIIYSSVAVNSQSGSTGTTYTSIVTTYVCLIDERWLVCVPVVRPIEFSDR